MLLGKESNKILLFLAPCTSNQHDVSAAALTASESNMVESPMSQIYLLALWLASSGSYLFFNLSYMVDPMSSDSIIGIALGVTGTQVLQHDKVET